MLKGIIYCEAFLSPELVEFIYNIPRVINFLEHVRHSPFMPKYIGSEKIKELFKKEEGIEQKLIEETKLEELKVGDKVLINQGSFSSFEGKITRVYNKTQEADVDLNYNNEGKLIVNILLERVPQKFCTKKIE